MDKKSDLFLVDGEGRKFLSIRQVCERLGICRMTHWRWVRDEKLPAPFKSEGRRLHLLSEIEDYERGLERVKYGARRVS